MSKYEIMFIIRADIEEDIRKKTVKSLEKALTDNKGVPCILSSLKTTPLL